MYVCDCYSSNGDDTESDVGPEMFIPFPVEMREETRERGDGWGLIGGLDEGKEYQFSVVAVVMMGEVSMSGERTQPVRATTRSTNGEIWGKGGVSDEQTFGDFVNAVLESIMSCTPTDDGGINAVIIISTIAGILLILILAGVVIIFITCCLIRYHPNSELTEGTSPRLVPRLVGEIIFPPCNGLGMRLEERHDPECLLQCFQNDSVGLAQPQ